MVCSPWPSFIPSLRNSLFFPPKTHTAPLKYLYFSTGDVGNFEIISPTKISQLNANCVVGLSSRASFFLSWPNVVGAS